jgi:hypothetical protein
MGDGAATFGGQVDEGEAALPAGQARLSEEEVSVLDLHFAGQVDPQH